MYKIPIHVIKKVIRNYIYINKSKIAIISSILIHSLFLFSIKSDKSLGTSYTPIEFTEIKIISGLGESIKKNSLSQIQKYKNQTNEKQKTKQKNRRNFTKVISEIPIKLKTTKKNIQKAEKMKKINKQNIDESVKNQKASILGDKSKTKSDEPLKGKLKGTGNKAIICIKCIEPFYSQQSIRKGLEGITTIKVTINTNGKVKDAIIVVSSGHKDIDNASMKAAMKSTFRPISATSKINIIYEHKIKGYR